jgi:hypothetical protein
LAGGVRADRDGSPLLVAAMVFVAVRLVSVAVLAGIAGPGGLAHRLSSWDGGYYLRIAQDGYPDSLAGQIGTGSPAAFFPLYPLAIRLADPLVPVGHVLVPALAVTLAAGTAAAVLIAAVCRRVFAARMRPVAARRAAVVVVAVWSAEPASFVLSMAYSEALFSALAAGCLLALLTGRWWVAGVTALLAGATRPTGAVLAACCLAAAAPALRRRRSAVPLAAVLLAPLGLIAYLGWTARRYHRADAWFAAQRDGWGMSTDGGITTVREAVRYVLHPSDRPLGLVVVAVIAASLILLVLVVRQRHSAVLAVYAAGLIAVGLSTHGVFGSMPRFVLPAFPLLLPLGPPVARLSTARLATLLAVAAALVGVAAAWVTGQTVLPP